MGEWKNASDFSPGSDGDLTGKPGVPEDRSALGTDEDLVSVDDQRQQGVGPDFDPDYFEKLETLVEATYGRPVAFRVVSG